MRVSEESYEYKAFFDRNFDPLVGIDSYTKKSLVNELNNSMARAGSTRVLHR
jgi:hypothetical protein